MRQIAHIFQFFNSLSQFSPFFCDFRCVQKLILGPASYQSQLVLKDCNCSPACNQSQTVTVKSSFRSLDQTCMHYVEVSICIIFELRYPCLGKPKTADQFALHHSKTYLIVGNN
jgi:hypothetical protein